MSECELVITVDVDENSVALSTLMKHPPCFLLLDSTHVIFHTLFNMYHYGFNKITIITPECFANDINAIINMCQETKINTVGTDLFACQFQTGIFAKAHYDDSDKKQEHPKYDINDTALQCICEMISQKKICGKNIMMIQSSAYFDIPPQIILDVHRVSGSTVTIIHSSQLQEQPGKPDFRQGCSQICRKISLDFKQDLKYSVENVLFYTNLNKEKLSDQQHQMSMFPINLLQGGKCKVHNYTRRPAGIVVQTDILRYLDRNRMPVEVKKSAYSNEDIYSEVEDNFQINLYENIVNFLCEQAQLPVQCQNLRIRNYVDSIIERQQDSRVQSNLQQNSPQQEFMDASVSRNQTPLVSIAMSTESVPLSQQAFTGSSPQNRKSNLNIDEIIQQYAEPLFDENTETILDINKRIVINSIQFGIPQRVESQKSTFMQIFKNLVSLYGAVAEDKVSVEQRIPTHQRSLMDLYKTPYMEGAIISDSVAQTFKIPVIQNVTPTKKGQNEDDQNEIDKKKINPLVKIQNVESMLNLEDFNGGIIQLSTRDDYLALNLLLNQFGFLRIRMNPEGSIKARVMNFKFLLSLQNEDNKLLYNAIIERQIWASNMETLYELKTENIYQSSIHSQVKQDKNLIDNTANQGKSTVIKIQGVLDNCIIASSVTIGKNVKMTRCVVLKGCAIDGNYSFEDCVFGTSCQFLGSGSASKRLFRSKFEHIGQEISKQLGGENE